MMSLKAHGCVGPCSVHSNSSHREKVGGGEEGMGWVATHFDQRLPRGHSWATLSSVFLF